MSLTTLESLEEVKQAVLASHGALPRDRVTAQATPCSEHELAFTLVITAGNHSFRPADGVALSRADISKREYIGEVTAIDGIILTVNIVWPTNSDDSSTKNILEGKWYLYKFPSLVGYRRITTALRAFQDVTSWGRSLFEGIVGSFCVSDPSSPGTFHKNSFPPTLPGFDSGLLPNCGLSLSLVLALPSFLRWSRGVACKPLGIMGLPL